MTSFNDIEFNKIDLPFISGINDKKGIRLFYKNNNIHDDIIIKLAPCLCPFGLKTFNNISIVTCSLANSSRKRIKDIKSFENKIESKLYKLYPQFKQYSLKSFIDDQYRFSLSVNLNDIRVFDQKLNLLDRDSIRPQCFIEPAICLYEIWIKTEERRWGLNCKLLQFQSLHGILDYRQTPPCPNCPAVIRPHHTNRARTAAVMAGQRANLQ